MEGGIEHRTVEVNGISMHIAEKGEGPVVLLVHGFPELWYSWRHQIVGLAAQGYHAVAPDLRGYGDTTAPSDITSYTIFHLVGDLIALIDSLGQDQVNTRNPNSVLRVTLQVQLLGPIRKNKKIHNKCYSVNMIGYIYRLLDILESHIKSAFLIWVFLVGHDWGAVVTWHLCKFRPDRVKALVNLSVPFSPRNPSVKTVDYFRSIYGDDHYICRFQEPGDIEAEFARHDTSSLFKKLLTSREPAPFLISKFFNGLSSLNGKIELPSWLSEDDIDYFTSKFNKSGFTGGINYYRCLDGNWEMTAPWSGTQIKVPVKFIVGDLDLTYHIPGIQDYIHKGGFKAVVPMLEEVVVMEGVAHFIIQEKAEEVTKHIYDFFQKFQ